MTCPIESFSCASNSEEELHKKEDLWRQEEMRKQEELWAQEERCRQKMFLAATNFFRDASLLDSKIVPERRIPRAEFLRVTALMDEEMQRNVEELRCFLVHYVPSMHTRSSLEILPEFIRTTRFKCFIAKKRLSGFYSPLTKNLRQCMTILLYSVLQAYQANCEVNRVELVSTVEFLNEVHEYIKGYVKMVVDRTIQIWEEIHEPVCMNLFGEVYEFSSQELKTAGFIRLVAEICSLSFDVIRKLEQIADARNEIEEFSDEMPVATYILISEGSNWMKLTSHLVISLVTGMKRFYQIHDVCKLYNTNLNLSYDLPKLRSDLNLIILSLQKMSYISANVTAVLNLNIPKNVDRQLKGEINSDKNKLAEKLKNSLVCIEIYKNGNKRERANGSFTSISTSELHDKYQFSAHLSKMSKLFVRVEFYNKLFLDFPSEFAYIFKPGFQLLLDKCKQETVKCESFNNRCDHLSQFEKLIPSLETGGG